jgi:cyclopropane-fatty-acyl-phospholipid synthase
MTTRTATSGRPARSAPVQRPHLLNAPAERAVRAGLTHLVHGELTLVCGGRVDTYGRITSQCAVSVVVHVHDIRFWGELAFGGSIGAGEAYMEGYWTTNDLTALVRILLANRDVLDAMEGGYASLIAPVRRALHWLNRNTRKGSRRNISAHYDLGNEFFALFLDPSMMYSCAIFERADMTLAEAQVARLSRVCERLHLKASDHLLEIGTGWGGMAIYAAQHYGCRVTTTTISQKQHDLAVERVRAAKLENRIAVLLEDYRELEGRYDKLVSLEMIEAVGHEWYDTYFRQCSKLLAPDGVMLLQAITIADQQYDAARRSVDFIQRYIFPGCCIPSVSALCSSVARATDMRLVQLDDIGPHYATTLRHWRQNFMARLDAVRALGYPDSFIRMWEFYLAYCEGGFEERALGDVHMVLAKPQYRG